METEHAYAPAQKTRAFAPSSAKPIVLHAGDTLHLRRINAQGMEAGITLELQDTGSPAGPRLAYESIAVLVALGGKPNPGIDLLAIAEAVNTSQEPVVYAGSLDTMEERHSILGLLGVDLEGKTVTFILDAAFETYERSAEPASS